MFAYELVRPDIRLKCYNEFLKQRLFFQTYAKMTKPPKGGSAGPLKKLYDPR